MKEKTIIRNTNNVNDVSEKVLKDLILENIDLFL